MEYKKYILFYTWSVYVLKYKIFLCRNIRIFIQDGFFALCIWDRTRARQSIYLTPIRNKFLVTTLKYYSKSDINIFWSCQILLDFFFSSHYYIQGYLLITCPNSPSRNIYLTVVVKDIPVFLSF